MSRPFKALAVLCLASVGSVAFVPLGLAQGDGSRTDNPDLLRGAYMGGCAPGTLCDFPAVDLYAPPTVVPRLVAPAAPAAPAAARMMAAAPAVPAPAASLPVAMIPGAQPLTVMHVQPRTEWEGIYQLGLRGAYVRSGDEERFEFLAIPEVAFSRAAAATDFEVGATATLVAPDTSDARLGEAALSGSVTHRLSPGAALTFNADLARTEDAPDGLDVDETNVADAPATIRGDVSGAYGQQLGRFDLLATAGITNSWTEPTEFDDGTVGDNSDEGVLGYEGGLRVGYALTPVVGTFVQGQIGREDYLAEDPELFASRSGVVSELRGGVSANWSDVITAEASVGRSWRDYDNRLVSDARAWLYGVSVGFAPTSTTRFAAGLQTALEAGDGASGASAAYSATLDATHRINPWIALRASASTDWDMPVDGSTITRTYGAGVGADFAIGPHATAALDYAYGWRDDSDPASPARDEHRISGGVTLRY